MTFDIFKLGILFRLLCRGSLLSFRQFIWPQWRTFQRECISNVLTCEIKQRLCFLISRVGIQIGSAFKARWRRGIVIPCDDQLRKHKTSNISFWLTNRLPQKSQGVLMTNSYLTHAVSSDSDIDVLSITVCCFHSKSEFQSNVARLQGEERSRFRTATAD